MNRFEGKRVATGRELRLTLLAFFAVKTVRHHPHPEGQICEACRPGMPSDEDDCPLDPEKAPVKPPHVSAGVLGWQKRQSGSCFHAERMCTQPRRTVAVSSHDLKEWPKNFAQRCFSQTTIPFGKKAQWRMRMNSSDNMSQKALIIKVIRMVIFLLCS